MFNPFGGNNALPPKPKVEIKITGIESLPGRKTEYARAFGTIPTDPKGRVVVVHLSARDAALLIEDAARDKQFPTLEVPKDSFAYVLNAGEVKVVHFGEKE